MDTSTQRWRKSSFSAGNNGDCVELGHEGAVRDSKNPVGPILALSTAALVTAVKTGQITR